MTAKPDMPLWISDSADAQPAARGDEHHPYPPFGNSTPCCFSFPRERRKDGSSYTWIDIGG